jgi:hypothetical protein
MGSSALEHFLISLVGSILGAGLGVGVGYSLNRLFHRHRVLLKTVSLSRSMIPWRTLLAFLLMVNFYPIYLILRFGLHSIVGMISIAYFTMISLAPLTLQVLAQKHSAQPPELFGYRLMRSLGVFAPILATQYSQFGSSWNLESFGLGDVFNQRIITMEYEKAFLVLLTITAVSLLVDLITGYHEYRIYLKMSKRDEIARARSEQTDGS